MSTRGHEMALYKINASQMRVQNLLIFHPHRTVLHQTNQAIALLEILPPEASEISAKPTRPIIPGSAAERGLDGPRGGHGF